MAVPTARGLKMVRAPRAPLALPGRLSVDLAASSFTTPSATPSTGSVGPGGAALPPGVSVG
jgi:hypothetical protein